MGKLYFIPDTVLENMEDGTVLVRVGDQVGWVSSHHLVPTKESQLVQAWVEARALEAAQTENRHS